MNKLEDENGHAKDDEVPRIYEGEIYQRISLEHPPYVCSCEQEKSGSRHSNDHPGMKPIQTFPLIECAEKQAQARAEVSKPNPTWSRTRRRAAAGNAEVHAKHHQRGEHGGVPKYPVPGKVVGVPALECGGDIARKNDVSGVGRDTENDQTFRERRQDKGHGE